MPSQPTLGPISPQSISFESIKEDLITWAKAKPDGSSWSDWFATSDGTIISEWIAGLGTFVAYHDIMRIRESQLDEAQLPTSIYEHAFNRGLLVPPSSTAELLLTIKSSVTLAVSIGAFVATLADYECYSLESKTLTANVATTLRVAVGHLQNYPQTVAGLKAFQAMRITLPEDYVALQLETLTVDGVPVPLVSDVDYDPTAASGFVLRRTLPSQVRIYFGNGTLGWTKPNAKEVTYSCLTFDKGLETRMAETPSLLLGGTLVDSTVLIQPSYDPSPEEVRETARFYPLDGRIVKDVDYESAVRKNFGGYVFDVYSYNSIPNQEVFIIKSSNFGTGSQQTEVLARISNLIDIKRGLGMNVVYTLKAVSDGKTFVPGMKVATADYSNALLVQANEYLELMQLKFQREQITYTSVDIATALSATFGVQITPTDATQSITLEAADFFQRLQITMIPSSLVD